MESSLLEPELSLGTKVALDRSAVIVRAPLEHVVFALAPFAGETSPRDAASDLASGLGLDELLGEEARSRGRRAVLYRLRESSYVGLIREGDSRSAHDEPLARRLSRELSAPALALNVSGSDVAYALFHEGRSLERFLCLSGEVLSCESRFDLDPDLAARDPYGRVLRLLRAYGLEDDRLSFDDFARSGIAFRRWDVTVEECVAFPELLPWPRGEALLDTGSWKKTDLQAA